MSSLPSQHTQLKHSRGVFHLHRASFVLSGAEARRWCNGMFSNNIRSLKIGNGNRSAICNPKGQVQGLLDIYCIDDQQFLVVLDGISQEDFEKRFAPFMMLDDIELDDVHQELISIQGPKASQILLSLNIDIPSDQDVQQYDWGYIVRKDRFGARRATHGFDIITSKLDFVLESIQKQTHLFSVEDFEHHRILTLQAKYPDDIGERAFLHELGINEECCSFNKGCYVGQEIINRMDVKGLVNKKLLRYQGSAPFEIGETVMSEEKKAGVVRSACQIQDTYYALIMVRKASWGAQLSYSGGIATESPDIL